MERITRDKLVKKVADNLQDKSINFSIPYHGKYKKKYSQQIIETVLTELLNTTIAELEKGNAVVIREYFQLSQYGEILKMLGMLLQERRLLFLQGIS